MSDIVIQAEALGKQYIIGHQAEKGYVAVGWIAADVEYCRGQPVRETTTKLW